jgi:integrase
MVGSKPDRRKTTNSFLFTVGGNANPMAVEQWLKKLDLAPKTKGHLQNLLRVIFNWAMRWELVEIGENPMKLVRVRGGSKRQKQPMVLTITQFQRLIEELDDPYRTMVILDLATGLRCSELFALKWRDVIWDDLLLLVRLGIVDTIVSDVKTEYSRAGMPLDPLLAEVLLNWHRTTQFNKPDDWIFASPFKAGTLPWQPWRMQQRHIGPAAVRCGIGHIGWHTFRHTFRSLLDETGESAAGTDAPCRHPNNNEYLRQSDGAEQARRAPQGCLPRFACTSGLMPPYCP